MSEHLIMVSNVVVQNFLNNSFWQEILTQVKIYFETYLSSQQQLWTSKASGLQTEKIFEKLTFLEKSFNKDKSVGL